MSAHGYDFEETQMTFMPVHLVAFRAPLPPHPSERGKRGLDYQAPPPPPRDPRPEDKNE